MQLAGNLFDVIANGDETFSDVMQREFENAKKLYHEKLLPTLERQHGLRAEEMQKLPWRVSHTDDTARR